ncbi:MAG: LPS export ABC transporter permease LptG [Acidobacteria bacterium]|nr:MAG: LPS export ABC transporter permease LptG [Acidobacteriota bacterium]
MRRDTRYVMAEVLGPFILGFLLYTFLLLIQFLFASAEMIIRRGVPAVQVGKLLGLTLPNIVVLTIPMSFLFAILVAVGRLASDSELTALRASGVSLFSLYRPILVFSLLLTALNTYLMVDTLPKGNSALQQLRIDIITQSVDRQVEPRVFYEEWEGVMLYVFEVRPGESEWQGVFVAENLPSAENQVTVASRGEVRLDDAGERLVLHLEDAVVHKVDFRNPDKYTMSSVKSLDRVLVDRFTTLQRARTSKGLRELNLRELQERMQDPDASPQMRNLARVEIHKKFSIPAACIVFGLVGLPLGFMGGRGSRTSGFALSVAIVLVYYVFLNNGEEAARIGKMEPWLAMWLPNFLLGLAGLFMLARRNRDKNLLLLPIDRWLRHFQWAGRKTAAAEEAGASESMDERPLQQRPAQTDVVLRLPHFRFGFPSLLDRYVVKMFASSFLLVLLSGVSIYVVADLTQQMDDILKHEVSSSVVFDYYKYLSLQLAYEIAPVAVLVTILVVFGLLSKTNEVVAAKALGVSLYRLALPALVAAAVVALLAAVLQLRVLPASNARVAQLRDQIRGKTATRTYRRADRQWLFGQGRYIYNYLHYDTEQKGLQRLQVFEFNDDYQLARRFYANTASYLGDAWLFDSGWVRSYQGPSVLDYETFDQPVIDYYPETPEYFESEFKKPEAMSYNELKEHILEVQASGQAAPELEVELHKKISFPIVSLVMGLVALPFSFRLGRRGTLYGVGVGILLGMVFYGVFAFGSTLGETGALPPLVAVWSPSIAFAIFSLYLLLGVRS